MNKATAIPHDNETVQADGRSAYKENWKLLERRLIPNIDGTPYLERLTIIRTPWFQVLYHYFHTGDEDRCLHDHPWPFTSIILSGGYFEETPVSPGYLTFCKALGIAPHAPTNLAWYGPGRILCRPAEWKHRAILKPGTHARTLVFTATRKRSWGFWTKEGFVHWREFVAAKKSGGVSCE